MTLVKHAIVEEFLTTALSERYLTYALSTIMHRALPDARDGLKPVHRRVLYAMRQLKLDPSSSHKKCARVVGDVIGKYHPHGDQSVYDALVRLAQEFAVRYPLVDGQGNFGNVDGDNAAAMRYTESKLTPIAQSLLEGLDENCVDFRPNYDGSEEEPELLPSSIPNLLANGSTGIAVGMATSVPPHNLDELIVALEYIIDHPDVTSRELMQFVPGPDFPTGGVIVESPESLADSYETGRGGIKLRAKWEKEELERNHWQIVITQMPYQVQKSKLVERIAELINDKKAPLLADVRDESADDIRLVLEPRNKAVDAEVLMESLFQMSDLEVRFSMNMNVLKDGRTPGVVSLKEALQIFLNHRRVVLQRRSENRLGQIERRLVLLDGFIIIYLNLDRVIAIIRTEDEPKAVLMAEFQLNDIQAEAVLNMRLRSLRKLEEMELRRERDGLILERDHLQKLLSMVALQWAKIRHELQDMRKKFGKNTLLGQRRSQFAIPPQIDASVVVESFIEKEPITIICSKKGWIRALKGHQALDSEIKHRDGDETHAIFHACTTDKILIFAEDGRFFTLPADKIPGGRGMGEPLRLMIDLANDKQVIAIFPYEADCKFLVVNSENRGFIVKSNDVLAQTRTGKQVMTLSDAQSAKLCVVVKGDMVATVGDNRKILVFAVDEIPEMTRGKGVILQKFTQGSLTDVCIFEKSVGMEWTDQSNRLKTEKDLTLWLGRRASAGRMAPRGFLRSNCFHPKKS